MPDEQDTDSNDDQEESQDGQEARDGQESTEEEREPEGADEEQQQTFDREYVQQLRDEAAAHRIKSKHAGELSAALWEARVTASGRLADASDLAMPEGADPLDAEAVGTAIEELLARKPHLASRALSGNIGQGAAGGASGGSVDLGGMLRAGA